MVGFWRGKTYVWPAPLVLVLEDGLPPGHVLVLCLPEGGHLVLVVGRVQRGWLVQHEGLAVRVPPT